MKQSPAATELLLLSPAILALTSILVLRLQSRGSSSRRTTLRIAQWYAGRQWTLPVLLAALPLAVLVTGCATLLRAGEPTPDCRRPRGDRSRRSSWPRQR